MADADSQESSDLTTLHVRGAVKGDAPSLEWLIARFTPLLLECARYRLGATLQRHYDAEDIVNELWMSMIPRLGDLVPRDGRMTPVLLHFLTRALIGRVNNALRKFVIRPAARGGVAEQVPSELAAQVTGLLTRLRQDERAERLVATLDQLSPDDRRIVILRGIEQLSNQDAARELGIAPATAATRYHRALQRLRTLLPDSVFSELES